MKEFAASMGEPHAGVCVGHTLGSQSSSRTFATSLPQSQPRLQNLTGETMTHIVGAV